MKTIHILADREYDILKKYDIPKRIEDEDKRIIINLASIGYMTTEFHEESNKVYETAVTTDTGIEAINLERISRNPKALKFSRLFNQVRNFA